MLYMFGITMTDSKIAQEYQCGRPKTAAVLKHLATEVKCSIESAMKSGQYCILTDGSKDQMDKQFPHPHDFTNPPLIHTTEHFHSF